MQVLEGLEQRGFNLAYTSSNGSTALHFAASGGHVEAIQYLIKWGCDVHTKNADGSTPLDLARLNGNWEAAEVLTAAVARGSTDLDRQSHRGEEIPSVQQSDRQEAPLALVDADLTNGCRDEASTSSDSDESDNGGLERLHKLVEIGERGASLAADAFLEIGDSVCTLFANKLDKVKKKKEKACTRSLKVSFISVILFT